jgi:hypothetical protein
MPTAAPASSGNDSAKPDVLEASDAPEELEVRDVREVLEVCLMLDLSKICIGGWSPRNAP